MIINNKFLNSIFTEYNESLTKRLNIDPLGFQIVWTFFGQKIFHNKTTSVALDIRSYNINLFNHYIIYQIIQEYKELSFKKLIADKKLISNYVNLKEKIEKTLIILENLLTWSWFSNREEWKDKEQRGLLGTYKVISLWEGKESLLINFNEKNLQKIQVLENQRALGVSGRYKGPFRAMGFFEDYEESSYKRSSEIFENEIKELIESDDSPFKNLYDTVILFLQKAQESHTVQIGRDDKIVDCFVACFKNPNITAKYTSKFWKKYLGLTKDESMTVYDCIDLPEKDKSIHNAKQIFACALNKSPDNKIFQDINQLEPQLTYLTLLFNYLTSKSEYKVNELDNRYISLLEKFKWDNLSIDKNTSVFERVKELKKIKDYQTLIDYHKLVMKKREQIPWIKIENDTIKSNIIKNINPKEIKVLREIKLDYDWIHDYYIYSMRNIKSGLSL